MKYISFLFSCFLFVSASAIQIDGVITNSNNHELPKTVSLNRFGLLDSRRTTDTTNVTRDAVNGYYHFNLNITEHGFYYLIVGKSKYTVFLSPEEKQIRITTDLNDQQKIWIENSPENDAYKVYNEYNQFYFPQFMKLFQEHYFDTIDNDLKSFYKDYFSGLKQVADKYPNTYTTKTLINMRMFATLEKIQETKDLRGFMKEHFLDHFSWKNPELLNEGSYNDCFMSYVAFLTDTNLAPFKKYYDKYFSEKSGINSDIYKYGQAQLFNYFITANNEDRLTYLINQSLEDERMKDAGLNWQMQSVKQVLPGNQYIPMTGIQQDGSTVTLTDFIARNKLSLLLFYSPDCSHCKEAMPEIKHIYDTYHPKGFDVYAVSIIDDRDKWINLINEKQMTWTNVLMQHEAGKQDAASQYFLTNTPTYVLIDNSGKILLRYTGLGRLEDTLKSLLK